MESKLAGQVVDGSVNQTQWEDQRKTVNVMYGLGQVMVVGGVSSLVASIWLDGRLSPAVPVRPRVQILADPIGKTAGLEVYNAW